MKILRMTATFGRLDRAVLTPGPGLTLIEAPNEGGKSTWAAFLRAMLYGFPPRDRDSKGYLAEKNRYQPWSGAAIEGTLCLLWEGREITLHRGPRNWGTFSAVYTATGDPVPGLTSENCGEKLLGVSREVFERTAFVGQEQMALSPSVELERRVASLAAGGEEEVSFSQVERRLKDWQNRRRSNSRASLIPKLEGELDRIGQALTRQEELLRQIRQAQGQRETLERQSVQLQEALNVCLAYERDTRRREAKEGLEEARSRYAAAQAAAGCLPTRQALQEGQGDLHYLSAVEKELREVRETLPTVQEELAQVTVSLTTDPLFSGKTAEQAGEETREDYNEVLRLQKKGLHPLALLGLLAGCAVGAAAGWLRSLPLAVLGAALGGAVAVLLLLFLNRGKKRRAGDILAHYQAQTPEDILRRSSDYGDRVVAQRELQGRVQSLETQRKRLTGQWEDLTSALTALVRPFRSRAGGGDDFSRLLHWALSREQNLRDAQAGVEAAQRVLNALPETGEELPQRPPQGDKETLEAQLEEVRGELSRCNQTIARWEGELRTMGDPDELSARRDALSEELDRRKQEYEALGLALEGMRWADSLLRERFSPRINALGGQYLSALTGGRYPALTLNRQFQATAGDKSELTLSTGTAQQLYLAARLALCDTVLPQRETPLLLDDALGAFDDQRCALALQVLLDRSGEGQVLLFTCQSREGRLLAGENVKRLKL